jgi:Tfp pilus assembly protein PilE
MQRRHQAGLTLVQFMIAIGLLGIALAVAVSAYRHFAAAAGG